MNIILNKNYNDSNTIKERFNNDYAYVLSSSSFLSSNDIEELKEKLDLASSFDILLVIGDYNNYIGIKALYEALHLNKKLLFLGYNYNASTYNEVFNYVKGKNYAVNIIAKSEFKLELQIASSLVLEKLEEDFNDYKGRIFITTSKGSELSLFAKENNFPTLYIPSRITEENSIFTVASIFPLSFAGFDYQKFILGFDSANSLLDLAINYAYFLKDIKIKGLLGHSFTVFEEELLILSHWLIQIFSNTRILMVNNAKDNNYLLAKTIITKDPKEDIYISKYHNFLAFFNEMKAMDYKKEQDNKFLSPYIEIDEIDEFNLGEFMHFMIIVSNIINIIDNDN